MSRPVIACLVLFAAILFLQRLHTYSEAIERDIAGYAVIAHEMLRGRNLYSDLWERKPPLLYGTFALAQWVCGYGPQEIFLLNIAAATTTLVALYFVGYGLGKSRAAGLFTAFLWLLLGGDMNTQANQPNAEVFVNACLSIAFALLLNWPKRKQISAAVLLGALLAAATLYKQHVVVTCVALLAAHLCGAGKRNRSFERLKEIAVAGSVIGAAWISIAIYFLSRHRFTAFVDVLFRQNISYSGDIAKNVLTAFLPRNLAPEFAPWVLVMLPLVFTAIAFGPARKKWLLHVHPHLLLWAAWATGSAITFVLPGKYFGHYFQLWIPVWCTAGGWSLAMLAKEIRPGYRLLNRGMIAAAIGCLLGLQGTQYLASADEWAHHKYPVDDFSQERKMGLGLARLLPAGHCFYNLGEDTPLYFYSQRSPASGLLYLGPLESGSEAALYQRRLMGDLDRAKPDLIVTSTLRNTSLRRQQELSEWIHRHYVPIETDLGCPIYRVFARMDTALASRNARIGKSVAAVELNR